VAFIVAAGCQEFVLHQKTMNAADKETTDSLRATEDTEKNGLSVLNGNFRRKSRFPA